MDATEPHSYSTPRGGLNPQNIQMNDLKPNTHQHWTVAVSYFYVMRGQTVANVLVQDTSAQNAKLVLVWDHVSKFTILR